MNLASSPSSLKITDMRYAVIVKPGPSPCVLIRIDTNQGVYGLGEVRDIAGPQYAMVLKSRILGENPLQHRLFVSEDRAVWRRSTPGRWCVRGGDGALGYCRQGLQHSGLPDARRQVARRDSYLCRYDRIHGPEGIRPPRQRAKGDGPDLDEDGPGHRCARRDSRHGDAACRA